MKLKSNIGKIIDESPYKRDYIRKVFNRSRNTVSAWCTGKSYPTVNELFELAKLLDVKVDDLYDMEEEKKP
ncbi:helix-turn-helix transcriptional regulator [Bacillus massiliigorillae]|uniref:helix-turn-helix transcriptional regulator n=1 Tax=Bacillus massiliigorillae TaxID=1243664 RepID=UPI0003AABEA2|nr:helix-turn-helix transcriptional regulator [Bacillus massiliigorillae]